MPGERPALAGDCLGSSGVIANRDSGTESPFRQSGMGLRPTEAHENLLNRRPASWPLPGPLELQGMGRMRKTAPIATVGCTMFAGQQAKTEALD